MEYKRIEIYVWWTCNHKCTYCIEYEDMEKFWNKRVTKYEILKKLLKYKKEWYNHVTYLWGEPFIQPVFEDALKIAKKLWYTILVTTNCTVLHIDNIAKKYLPYIDELILSVEAIDEDLQKKISRTPVVVKWDEVFKNIKKYWRWKYLKVNTVITKDNLNELYDIVKYVVWKGVKNIAITYPDLDDDYLDDKRYLLDFVKARIAPRYSDCMVEIEKIKEYCDEKWVKLKIVDFPFCIFPKDKLEEYIKLTDDYDYDNRIKVNDMFFLKEKIVFNKIDRKEFIPRERLYGSKCKNCKYKSICWGVSEVYLALYDNKEIQPILMWFW